MWLKKNLAMWLRKMFISAFLYCAPHGFVLRCPCDAELLGQFSLKIRSP